MNDQKSIFIKQNDIAKDEHKLVYSEILNSIPNDRFEKEQPELKKTHTEWRWRFFEIDGKKLVEISVHNNLTKERKYVDKYGKWIEKNVDPVFDKFVVNQYFCYSDN